MRPGAIVVLKSGGPNMLVLRLREGILPNGGDELLCAWSDGESGLALAEFPSACVAMIVSAVPVAPPSARAEG